MNGKDINVKLYETIFNFQALDVSTFIEQRHFFSGNEWKRCLMVFIVLYILAFTYTIKVLKSVKQLKANVLHITVELFNSITFL